MRESASIYTSKDLPNYIKGEKQLMDIMDRDMLVAVFGGMSKMFRKWENKMLNKEQNDQT